MSGTDPNGPESAGWDRGFEGHAEAQRRRIAALPLWLRIEWLEETQRLLERMKRVDLTMRPDDILP